MHCTWPLRDAQVPVVPVVKLQKPDKHTVDVVQVEPSGSLALQVGIAGVVVVSQ